MSARKKVKKVKKIAPFAPAERFEVHDKDENAFWDHRAGVLYYVEDAGCYKDRDPAATTPGELVARIVLLLNLDEREGPLEEMIGGA